jgi:hypothetical protein
VSAKHRAHTHCSSRTLFTTLEPQPLVQLLRNHPFTQLHIHMYTVTSFISLCPLASAQAAYRACLQAPHSRVLRTAFANFLASSSQQPYKLCALIVSIATHSFTIYHSSQMFFVSHIGLLSQATHLYVPIIAVHASEVCPPIFCQASALSPCLSQQQTAKCLHTPAAGRLVVKRMPHALPQTACQGRIRVATTIFSCMPCPHIARNTWPQVLRSSLLVSAQSLRTHCHHISCMANVVYIKACLLCCACRLHIHQSNVVAHICYLGGPLVFIVLQALSHRRQAVAWCQRPGGKGTRAAASGRS